MAEEDMTVEDLDPTNPDDTEEAAKGASRIRETRYAVKDEQERVNGELSSLESKVNDDVEEARNFAIAMAAAL